MLEVQCVRRGGDREEDNNGVVWQLSGKSPCSRIPLKCGGDALLGASLSSGVVVTLSLCWSQHLRGTIETQNSLIWSSKSSSSKPCAEGRDTFHENRLLRAPSSLASLRHPPPASASPAPQDPRGGKGAAREGTRAPGIPGSPGKKRSWQGRDKGQRWEPFSGTRHRE